MDGGVNTRLHFMLHVLLMHSVSDPKFSGPIHNVTAPVGRDAILTCVVHELLGFKVAWLRVDTQTILSIQDHVVTKNHRIGVTHTEQRIWQLRIREVREADRGWYMCQINTDPMKSQVGYLDVVVPPDIADYPATSNDLTVDEGRNVSLTCSATGLPLPTITWRRERDQPLLTDPASGRRLHSVDGPNLTLWQARRDQAGVYLCIATNGVPPTVSKRVRVVVNFAPVITTRYELIHVGLGQRLTLECSAESQPAASNFWLKDNKILKQRAATYESVTSDNTVKIVMRLSVAPLKPDDLGEYKCAARNALGQAERSIVLRHKDKAQKKDVHHLHRTSEWDTQSTLAEDFSTNDASSSYGRETALSVVIFIYFCAAR